MASLRVLFLCLLCACGGGGGDDSPSGGSDAGEDAPPNGTAQFSVEFVSTSGTFTVDVTRAWSPNGADRFRELVEAQFYDGCRFFRVVPGFIVQFGINGTPVTNAEWSDNSIADDPVVESNQRAYLSFAKTAEPNSRTTQLFVNYGDNSFLDAMGFSPFGIVRSGMDNIDAINAEYGESPDQAQIESQGNTYLDQNFPNLDSITTARVVL